jgi:hypothetical protein
MGSGSPAIALAGWGAVIFGSYLGARGIFKSQTRKKMEQLTRLIDDLADHAERTARPGQLPRAQT